MGVAKDNCYAFLPETWGLLETIIISLEFSCCLASFYYFSNSSSFNCTLTVFYGYILLWSAECCFFGHLNVYIILHCFSFPICLCLKVALDRIYCLRILNDLTVSSIEKSYSLFGGLCTIIYWFFSPLSNM